MKTVNGIDIGIVGEVEITKFDHSMETVGTTLAPYDVGDLVRDFTLPTLDGREGRPAA